MCKIKKFFNIFKKNKSVSHSKNKENNINTNGVCVDVFIDNDLSLEEKLNKCKELSRKLDSFVSFENKGIKICIDKEVNIKEVLEQYQKIYTINKIREVHDRMIEKMKDLKDHTDIERSKAAMCFELTKMFLMQEGEKDNYCEHKSHETIVRDSTIIVNMIFSRFDVEGQNQKEFNELLDKLGNITK